MLNKKRCHHKTFWRQYKHNINLNFLLVERKPTSYLKVAGPDWMTCEPIGCALRGRRVWPAAGGRAERLERRASVPLHTSHRTDVLVHPCVVAFDFIIIDLSYWDFGGSDNAATLA